MPFSLQSEPVGHLGRLPVHCEQCNAECCRYVGIRVSEPRDLADCDELNWYLYHKGVCIYIDEGGDWCVQVRTRCRYLARDNRCGNYQCRPQVCRDHEVRECEANPSDSETGPIFMTPEQFHRYIREHYALHGGRLRRRREPGFVTRPRRPPSGKRRPGCSLDS